MADHPSGDDPENSDGPMGRRLQASLRAAFEKVAGEPLPRRLRDLLARLRDKERKDPPPDA